MYLLLYFFSKVCVLADVIRKIQHYSVQLLLLARGALRLLLTIIILIA